MTLDEIIEKSVKAEGGYVNDPADKGGETNYGITVAVARSNGYQGPMSSLPLDTAKRIYRTQYIVAPGFDAFSTVSTALVAELFDTGVNMGPATATKFLQRAVNALQGSGLAVDGKMGPATRGAVVTYLNSRANAAEILVKALNCLQGVRYIELVEANASQRRFINGWLANRVEI